MSRAVWLSVLAGATLFLRIGPSPIQAADRPGAVAATRAATRAATQPAAAIRVADRPADPPVPCPPVTLFTKFAAIESAWCKLELVVRDHPDPMLATGRLPGEARPSLVELVKTPLAVNRDPKESTVLFRSVTRASRFGEFVADAVVDEAGGRVYLVRSLPSGGFAIGCFSASAELIGVDDPVNPNRPIPLTATIGEAQQIVRASLERRQHTALTVSPETDWGSAAITGLDLYKEADTLIVVATVKKAKPRRLQFDYSLTKKEWVRADPVWPSEEEQFPRLDISAGRP